MSQTNPRIKQTAIATALIMCSFAVPAFGASASPSFEKGMKPVVERYLQIQHALSDDSMKGVADFAREIVNLADKMDVSALKGVDAAHFKHIPDEIKKAAAGISLANTLDAARTEFKNLSDPMTLWARIQKPTGIQIVSCSMAKASWLQKTGEIRNPYYGKSMLTCGEIEGKDGACCQGKHEH